MDKQDKEYIQDMIKGFWFKTLSGEIQLETLREFLFNLYCYADIHGGKED